MRRNSSGLIVMIFLIGKSWSSPLQARKYFQICLGNCNIQTEPHTPFKQPLYFQRPKHRITWMTSISHGCRVSYTVSWIHTHYKVQERTTVTYFHYFIWEELLWLYSILVHYTTSLIMVSEHFPMRHKQITNEYVMWLPLLFHFPKVMFSLFILQFSMAYYTHYMEGFMKLIYLCVTTYPTMSL